MKDITNISKPAIHYTKIGDVNIAYQVFGSGPVDLVYIPGWISNIDWMWACPELVNFFKVLSKHVRLILFDKRGTGLSDRIVGFSTLEERMEDITAVMNAVNSNEAILFGHSEGGSVSALFSATFPNRVSALITFGIFAKRRYSEDYPWAPTDQERQKIYDMIETSWGSGDMNLESLAPTKANDPKFMDWLANYFRSGASPRAALELTKMNTQVNIIDILKYIKVPTLIMQRIEDIDVKIEEGKFISERIKNSKFVEFEGKDHLFWAGNTKKVLDKMIGFITTIKPKVYEEKGLYTIALVHLDSELKMRIKKELIAQLLEQYQGTIMQLDQKIYAIVFKVSGKAVAFATTLANHLKSLKIDYTMGLYIKEALAQHLSSMDQRDSYIIKTMRSQAQRNDIFVTQNIKYLLTGSAYDFTEKCSILEYNSCDLCKLYSVSPKTQPRKIDTIPEPYHLSKYNSFLEDVLDIIDNHIDDNTFSVEVLAKEIGIGERQLQRKIKDTLDKSPVQLITSIRLNKAKSALIHNYSNIAEIAFQFGFSSPSYFTKCFKKEFGVSPSELQSKV